MIVQQYFVKGISHSSYLLGANKTCAIVDPERDISVYLKAAKDLNMEITHILETHLHADFISGHMDLAEKTGAKIYAPKSANCKFDHVPVDEGDTIRIEDVELSILTVPGHTPEHIAYVMTDRARGQDPVGVFCGDALFVGDVGRPDLFPDMANNLASQLFHSLHDKLLKLPDFCQVYPAHGAGSLCGRAMGANRISTIGYERKYNAALQIENKDEFIKSLTYDMPPAPDHFSRCSDINRIGPTLRNQLPKLKSMSAAEIKQKLESGKIIALDIRNYDAFAGQHMVNSYHNDLKGNFATFAGWIIPPDRDMLLISEDEKQAREATVWLHRVGLDGVLGFTEGAMTDWVKEGLPASHIALLSANELYDAVSGKDQIVLVDVRAESEYSNYHIKGSIHIPVHDLRTRYTELDPSAPTILICGSGNRSSMGASLLKQKGFKNVSHVAGGMTGYSAAGYAPECPVCFIPHGPRFLGKQES
jgi:glyoxylase-like metal-dependent hydrolase (beta-lactamase superfamily II)/rhodanese-related sulfurtransferase